MSSLWCHCDVTLLWCHLIVMSPLWCHCDVTLLWCHLYDVTVMSPYCDVIFMMSLWCHMWHCKFNISSRSCTPGMYKLYCCTLWPMVFCTCWSTNCLCCTARAKSGMHLLHELWTPLPLSWQTDSPTLELTDWLPCPWADRLTPLPLSWQTPLPLSWQTAPLPLNCTDRLTPLPLSWQTDSLALELTDCSLAPELTDWLSCPWTDRLTPLPLSW